MAISRDVAVMSFEDAARKLGIKPSAIQRWARNGLLPVAEDAQGVFGIDEARFETWIESRPKIQPLVDPIHRRAAIERVRQIRDRIPISPIDSTELLRVARSEAYDRA